MITVTDIDKEEIDCYNQKDHRIFFVISFKRCIAIRVPFIWLSIFGFKRILIEEIK
jgi:hypothetical protein